MFDPAIKLFGRTISLPPAADDTGEEIQESSVERSLETDHVDLDESSQQEFHSINGEQRKKQPKKVSESSNQQKLNLKKPDKLLPCPRCDSLDTKFCYFNNYNVNQPRHFCKNCQRYWTAGGMMRNVPIGAGRRKNKHLRHLIVPSESTPSSLQVDHSDSGQSQPVRTVLKFGVDSPLCESMASVLHLSENGGESQPTQKSAPLEWTYPWTQALTGFAPAQMKDWSMLYGPAFVWGYGPAWPNQAWSLPLNFPSPSSTELSGPLSPSLGKHCRDSSLTVEEKREKFIWTPKTLRIVDPDEAAKSSIWSTLGIKPDPEEPSKKAGIFKGFRHKMDAGELSLEREKIMIHLNPAALSRSQTFQEST